ncbi:methylmalonyl-CoA epimerase [Shimazuella sp. AN120528]|uniref:methylmalonyl-CoA epimerase n=1 Tax=Shimazuella soli TaxID=1892854 RepID=UPI001F0ED3F5|nr:methylmalonyl-CoA epimerase [Shimazuella soli]MCH5584227.1 methylmalonyl-CoA epimerase [Shimazuella soli]
MSIQKISHIGIAVESLEKWIPYYRDTLGLSFLGKEFVASEKVQVAFFQIGESRLELLEPTDDSSPIAKHLQTRGEGFHHIAYEVDDITKSLSDLEQKGVSLIHKKPKRGAHQSQIAFLHPSSTGKILTELCQSQSREDLADAEKN